MKYIDCGGYIWFVTVFRRINCAQYPHISHRYCVTFVMIRFVSVFVTFAIYRMIIDTKRKTCETLPTGIQSNEEQKLGKWKKTAKAKKHCAIFKYCLIDACKASILFAVKWPNIQNKLQSFRRKKSVTSSEKKICIHQQIARACSFPSLIDRLWWYASQAHENTTQRNHVFI